MMKLKNGFRLTYVFMSQEFRKDTNFTCFFKTFKSIAFDNKINLNFSVLRGDSSQQRRGRKWSGRHSTAAECARAGHSRGGDRVDIHISADYFGSVSVTDQNLDFLKVGVILDFGITFQIVSYLIFWLSALLQENR